MLTRQDSLYIGLAFSFLMGVVGIPIHSMVDFNLQNPANEMMFKLLLLLAGLDISRKFVKKMPTKRIVSNVIRNSRIDCMVCRVNSVS